MTGSTTETLSKKPVRAPRAEPVAAPARVSRRKASVAAVEEATQAQAEEVKISRSASEENTPAKKQKRTKKEKVVRDSFTMPKSDYEKIAALKQKCADNGVSVKKSELLRAGLLLLAAASDIEFAAAVGAVEAVKTGRPANA